MGEGIGYGDLGYSDDDPQRSSSFSRRLWDDLKGVEISGDFWRLNRSFEIFHAHLAAIFFFRKVDTSSFWVFCPYLSKDDDHEND